MHAANPFPLSATELLKAPFDLIKSKPGGDRFLHDEVNIRNLAEFQKSVFRIFFSSSLNHYHAVNSLDSAWDAGMDFGPQFPFWRRTD